MKALFKFVALVAFLVIGGGLLVYAASRSLDFVQTDGPYTLLRHRCRCPTRISRYAFGSGRCVERHQHRRGERYQGLGSDLRFCQAVSINVKGIDI